MRAEYIAALLSPMHALHEYGPNQFTFILNSVRGQKFKDGMHVHQICEK